MESFEKICSKLINQQNFWPKIFLGIVLALIPIVNIFALGYLKRALIESRLQDDFTLPTWDISAKNMKHNFIQGLEMTLYIFIFLGVPMLIGYLLGSCLFLIGSSFKLLFVYCGFLIGAPTFVNATLFINNISELLSMKIVRSMFSMTINIYKLLMIPSFLFLCLNILSIQLLPVAMVGGVMFFGLVFMIAFMRNLKIVGDR